MLVLEISYYNNGQIATAILAYPVCPVYPVCPA